MMRGVAACACILATSCSAIFGLEPPELVAPSDGDVDVDGGQDASPDAPPMTDCMARWANGTVRFNAPVEIPGLDAPGSDASPSLTDNDRAVFWVSNRAGSMAADIWLATRPDTSTPWSSPILEPTVNTASNEQKITLPADRLEVVVMSNRAGGVGGNDLWSNRRISTSVAFGVLDQSDMTDLNDVTDQNDPAMTPDGLRLYFTTASRIWISTRQTRQDPWPTASPIPALDGTRDPCPVADETLLLFTANRIGGAAADIFYTTRASSANPFGVGQLIPDLTTVANENDPWLSSDGCTVYFSSDRDDASNTKLFSATMRTD